MKLRELLKKNLKTKTNYTETDLIVLAQEVCAFIELEKGIDINTYVRLIEILISDYGISSRYFKGEKGFEAWVRFCRYYNSECNILETE